MSSHAPRRTPMMSLRELVDRYRALAGGFTAPVPLSSFQLAPTETAQLFSLYDEDYHISRFFHFSEQPGAEKFLVNGISVTHVSLDPEISTIL